jgi:uncharacterized protein (DUF2252 family)
VSEPHIQNHDRTNICELGSYAPTPNRGNPVATLIQQGQVRVSDLLPIRYSRMAVSPFTFYRGAAAVMADDLGGAPNSGVMAQLCGDAHLGNFGIFATAERGTIFDVNDFDETYPGPFEWDVKRLVTSFVLATEDRPKKLRQAITQSVTDAYQRAIQTFAEMSYLDTWYYRVDAQAIAELTESGALLPGGHQTMNKGFSAAQKRTQWSAVKKLTTVVNGQREFINDPPLIMRLQLGDGVRDGIEVAFNKYKETLLNDRRQLLDRYTIVDFGHKVVGVGSVGLLAYIVLLQGRDENDLLVIQVKEAVPSVLEPWVSQSLNLSPGERVIDGQRLIQAATDAFLGWFNGAGGRSFYLRQLRDLKWSPDVSQLKDKELLGFAQICGGALARAHARSGNAVEISNFLGTGPDFDDAMNTFANEYAQQVNADYAEFLKAIDNKQISTDVPEDLAFNIDVDNDGAFILSTSNSAESS